MKISLAYIVLTFISNLVLVSLLKNKDNLVKFLLASSSRYQTLSYIIGISDAYDSKFSDIMATIIISSITLLLFQQSLKIVFERYNT